MCGKRVSLGKQVEKAVDVCKRCKIEASGEATDEEMIKDVMKYFVDDFTKANIGSADYTNKLLYLYQVIVGLNPKLHSNQWIFDHLSKGGEFLNWYLDADDHDVTDPVVLMKLQQMMFIVKDWLPEQKLTHPVEFPNREATMKYVRSMFQFRWYHPDV